MNSCMISSLIIRYDSPWMNRTPKRDAPRLSTSRSNQALSDLFEDPLFDGSGVVLLKEMLWTLGFSLDSVFKVE